MARGADGLGTHRSFLSCARRLRTSSTVTSKNSSGSSAGQACSSSSRSGWYTTASRSTGWGCRGQGWDHQGPSTLRRRALAVQGWKGKGSRALPWHCFDLGGGF